MITHSDVASPSRPRVPKPPGAAPHQTPARRTGPPGSGATGPEPAGSGEHLGARVRRLRLARGLTQRELAAPSYTRAFLAAIESGIRSPSEDALRHIAERLQVDVDDLRYGRPPGAAARLRDRLATARRALSHGRVSEAAAEFRRVREEAERYGLAELACWAGYFLGDVHLHLGEIGAALAGYDQVAAELPDGHQALRAAVVARQASCRFTAGDAPRAVAMLEGELRRLRAAPGLDPDAELRVISALIYAFNELDWRDRARVLEREAMVLLPRVTNREWRAQFCSTAAQLRRAEPELADVERLLAEAGRLYRELGLGREIGACHWARGYVLRRVGRLAEAAEEFQAACEVLHAVGAVQDHAGATLELAEVRRRQGALTEAAELASEAARICESSEHRECMAEADRLLGLVCAEQGDPAAAERLLRRSADRYEDAGLMGELLTTCGLLGDLLLAQQRPDEAMAMFRRGLRGAEKLR